MVIRKREFEIETLPLLALRGLVVFPDNSVHFDVGRMKSIAAIGECMQHDQIIFLVTQRDVAVDDPTAKHQLYTVGVVARVCQVLRSQGDTLRVMVEGLYRARLLHITQTEPYLEAQLVRCPETDIAGVLKERAYVRELRSRMTAYSRLTTVSGELEMRIHTTDDASELCDTIASGLTLPVEDKQHILRTLPVAKRCEELLVILERENSILTLEQSIQERVQEQVEQNQKEYYLREQMKAIAEELGESESPLEEAEEYRTRIAACQLTEEGREKLLKEVSKLSKMPLGSHEATVVRNYLDNILELPWGVYSADKTDLAQAAVILDRDHYGMKDVKERILEWMAVRHLSDSRSAQVICLVGPPGVGKTSIARSIAEATGRKYVRVSLGGVRDESDIRGHRKTYIGAMMGRIMTAVKQAGTANPLILLDEIDKMGNDFRGDPSSALLEVLDAEQNHAFVDHYVELPFDLSQVMFVTTANDGGAIPRPLYDRMDVLTLDSYTAEEKFHIAKKHLLKKQLKENGLTSKQLRISDKQLRAVIAGYTREAGVRQLERLLAKICRRAAKQILEGATTVSVKDLSVFLGAVKYKPDDEKHEDLVGVVNGLAWTSVGGEMLPIEVAVLDGTGKIELTGSLGDVMKESAHLAISYVRSRAREWQLPVDFYRTTDIHLHAPEGAVPKDGPSAGAAMATAVLSALSGVQVRGTLAMTGELSLRGKVLPIGGLKEKLMAAYANGMKTVLIPKDNVSDLEKVDEAVRNGLQIVPVSHMDDVIRAAFVSAMPAKADRIPISAGAVSPSALPMT
ncbi:MAG: endopeptidase La [Ruminococcaceae bacterium]|nr:endopeptidase La [Oscillospiraceae bacterium]